MYVKCATHQNKKCVYAKFPHVQLNSTVSISQQVESRTQKHTPALLVLN